MGKLKLRAIKFSKVTELECGSTRFKYSQSDSILNNCAFPTGNKVLIPGIVDVKLRYILRQFCYSASSEWISNNSKRRTGKKHISNSGSNVGSMCEFLKQSNSLESNNYVDIWISEVCFKCSLTILEFYSRCHVINWNFVSF